MVGGGTTMRRLSLLVPVSVLVVVLCGLLCQPALAASGSMMSFDSLRLPWSQWKGLNAVDFLGADLGWAVGDAGTIVHSTDGGVTWSGQDSGTATTLDGVSFGDADHGWAVGLGGAVLATSDGGATWVGQTSGTSVDLNDVAFADAQNGYAVGNDATVIQTTDGGAHWKVTSGVAG